jgi:hypothetical protein
MLMSLLHMPTSLIYIVSPVFAPASPGDSCTSCSNALDRSNECSTIYITAAGQQCSSSQAPPCVVANASEIPRLPTLPAPATEAPVATVPPLVPDPTTLPTPIAPVDPTQPAVPTLVPSGELPVPTDAPRPTLFPNFPAQTVSIFFSFKICLVYSVRVLIHFEFAM